MQLFKRLGIEPEPYEAVEKRRDNGAVEQFEPAKQAAQSGLFYNAAG